MIPARGRKSSSSNWVEELTRLVPQGEHATSHHERPPCQRTEACAQGDINEYEFLIPTIPSVFATLPWAWTLLF